MSMMKCPRCEKIYDTDYEMEVDQNWDCICDECYQSSPLKCEVDMVGFEGTYDALNKLTRRKA